MSSLISKANEDDKKKKAEPEARPAGDKPEDKKQDKDDFELQGRETTGDGKRVYFPEDMLPPSIKDSTLTPEGLREVVARRRVAGTQDDGQLGRLLTPGRGHVLPKVDYVDSCPTCWDPLDVHAIETEKRKPGEAVTAHSFIDGSTITTNAYTVDHAETMVAITKVEGQLNGGLVSGGKDNMMVGVNVETNSVAIIPQNDPMWAKIIDSKPLATTMGQAYEEVLRGTITPGEAKKLKAAQELLLGSLKDVDAEGHLNPAAEQKIVQAYKDLTAEALKDPARGGRG